MGKTDGEFVRVGKDAFAACPSDSIDYAVMERIAASSQANAGPATRGGVAA
jgi:mannose-1-phosphate guanylyltransferase/mannose-6-phosphate isomerase